MTDQYEEILSVECIRAPPKQLKPEEMEQKVEERTLDPNSQAVLRKTMLEGTDTVWDRLERQLPTASSVPQASPARGALWGHAA